MNQATMQNETITTFPVHGQDIFNYLAGEVGSDCQMHLLLKFKKHLNEKIIMSAAYQVAEAVPILGCRFIEDDMTAFFALSTPIKENTFCDILPTDTPENDVKKFIASSPESLHRNLWHIRIFRTNTEDTLCVKLNHTCSDAGGLLEIYDLLANFYTRLSNGETITAQPLYIERSAMPFLNSHGFEDPRLAWTPEQPVKDDSMVFPHTGNNNQSPAFCIKHLNKAAFTSLKAYGYQHGATINDLLLTAFYRALFKLTECEDNHVGRMSVSIDLRPHMSEQAKRIAANTSAAFTARIAHIRHEEFNNTLQRVSSMMTKQKNGHAEIKVAAIMETFGLMPFSAVRQTMHSMRESALNNKFVNITLSNVGKITTQEFADNTVSDAYFIGPAMFTPGLMLTASGFENTLTLAINFFSSDIKEDMVQILLNEIIHDLETCKPSI